MYTRIVVGTDGSDRSLIAVNRAAQMAERCGAELHVVSAAAPVVLGGETLPPIGLEAIRFSGSSARVATRLGSDLCVDRQLRVTEHTIVGEPASVLMAVADEVGADLIVVGNRGMMGKLRLFTGSVPNRVAHHAEVDVLIVSTD
jgi:nucleotide-binding universal stress UspA family protein